MTSTGSGTVVALLTDGKKKMERLLLRPDYACDFSAFLSLSPVFTETFVALKLQFQLARFDAVISHGLRACLKLEGFLRKRTTISS